MANSLSEESQQGGQQGSQPCDKAKDALFGPGLQCNQFDFTLLFEQTILSLAISSIFLLLFLVKASSLLYKPIQVRSNILYKIKTFVAFAIAAIQLALLILWCQNQITRFAIVSAAVGFVGALAGLCLIIIEAPRSIRPSTLLTVYLLASIVGEAVQIRTLFLREYDATIANCLCGSLASKVVLLCLESWSKKSYLIATASPYSPEELAGVFDRRSFWWLNKILLLGNSQILSLTDLYPLKQALHSNALRSRIIKSWDKRIALSQEVYCGKLLIVTDGSNNAYSFLSTTLFCFKWETLQTVPSRLAISGFTYAQTFLITASIKYLETPSQLRNQNHAYGLIGATALIYSGIAVSTAAFYQQLFSLTTSFRGAISALIYTKSLVNESGYNELAAVTLMSTDVERMMMSMIQGLDLWAKLIEVALGVYLLWLQLGAISIAPIIITVLCFFGQSWGSSKMGSRQARWVKAVQRRVGISSAVLRSMKSVKLSGLVDSMAALVQSERVRELDKAKQFRGLSVGVNMISNMPTIFSALVAFAAYSIKANIERSPPLTTSQAFTSFAILTLLTAPASQLLSSIPQLTAGMGCVRRVHKFIAAKSFQDSREITNEKHYRHHAEKTEKYDLQVDEKSSQMSDGPLLSVTDLTMKIPKSRDQAEAALVNFEISRGSLVTILGPVGCGKSTLLRCILGEVKPGSGSITIHSPVIAYCAQSPWLQNSKIRDAIIGPNEFDADWYQTIISVCQLESDFAQIPDNDQTLVGSRGLVLSGGQKHRVALARALYSRCSLIVLDDFLSSLDRGTQELIMTGLFSKDGFVHRHGCGILLATHITNFIQYSDKLIVLGPGGCLKYIGAPKNWTASLEKSTENEIEASAKPSFKNPIPSQSLPWMNARRTSPHKVDNTETVKRQTGDFGVWKYYGKAIGHLPLLFAVGFVMIAVFTGNFPKLWLQWNTGAKTPKTAVFVGVYFLISVISLLSITAMLYQFLMIIGPVSGIRLHNILVKSTFKAPMTFFETTDSSVLINRFSQDMSLIDMQLPMSAFGAFLAVFMCIMNLILICLGSTYIAATIPATLIALYFVQKYYLRTSRQMRLLELEHKSPLYQQFTETLEGLETVRALGWHEFCDNEAVARIDNSQRPFYLLYMIQRWLNFVLDALVAVMAVLLVALALLVPKSSSGGAIGVALSSVLSFNTSLKMLIMTWTGLETSLGSVARTQSFEKYTPSEEQDENFDPGANWPEGKVEVTNVTVTYGDGTNALRNVSFEIQPGQKIGVCGRTGSGKSTLLSMLMRLVDPSSGACLIDGIDISKVRRNKVRDRLICLPQDPLIFPGTFRFNLDPTSRIPEDRSLTQMLEKVGLWSTVSTRGGLAGEVKIDSLSHGEQQLLALARAILRKQIANNRCILVLDEATSNLDKETEALIQSTIREEFKANTVITVAHRLETVRESDAIIIFEQGEVFKIGPPSSVL